MQATIQYIKKELAELYPETEVQGFTRVLLEAVCGWNYTTQILKRDEKIGADSFNKIKAVVARLKVFEPLQYILGETEFMELKLKVTPAVLIPRPETEELVAWIAESVLGEAPRVLDIGTGSGCIALALKNRLQNATVSAVDISEEALGIARGNAVQNNLEVHFSHADILKWNEYNWDFYDIIVSNPPYIRELEKQQMLPNVLEHEPENALFVPDNDPLVFYREIAAFAKKQLVENGRLYFEINEKLSKDMNRLLAGFGFRNIEIREDINGKERMIFCEK